MSVSGTPNTTTTVAGEDFSFDIKNSIEILAGSSYVIPNELKAALTIVINEPDKKDIPQPVSSKGEESWNLSVGSYATYYNHSFTLTEGATWKSPLPTITFTPEIPDGLQLVPSISDTDTKKVLNFVISGSPTTSSSLTEYSFNIDENLIDIIEGYKIPISGLKGTIKIIVAPKE